MPLSIPTLKRENSLLFLIYVFIALRYSVVFYLPFKVNYYLYNFHVVSCMVILAYVMCREALLCYVTKGDDVQVLGSLSVLATLLQTKGCIIKFIYFSALNMLSDWISGHTELDESMLDALGILPQRKQHKKLLLVSCGDD